MSCCCDQRKRTQLLPELEELLGIEDAADVFEVDDAGDLSRFTDKVEAALELELESEIPKAIRLNRCMREWLGWNDYRQEVYRLLGFPKTCPTEEAFANAVRRWQQKSNLASDGIVGLNTLNSIRRALGRPALLTEPDRPNWAEWEPSPNHKDRDGNTIDRIIYHATSGTQLGQAINTFKSKKARTSAHYVVSRDGQVIQMVELGQAAHHAGGYYDARSVGIEIVNTGPLTNKGKKVSMCDAQEKKGNRWICTKWTEIQPIRARKDYYRHSRYWDRTEWWVPYSEAQYRSVVRLTRFLVSCIPTIRYITGHEHLLSWEDGKYKNRNDPGGAFDWPRIERALKGWFGGHVCRHYSRINRSGAVDPKWKASCPGFRP